MSRSILLAWFVLAACTRAETRTEASSTDHAGPPATERPGVQAPPAPPAPPPPPVTHTAPANPTAVTVEMTAVTLADACGGLPPVGAPPIKAKRTAKITPLKADRADEPRRRGRSARRRCEQTSMQLAVTAATSGTPTRLEIRKVELFDDAGGLVGVLAASSPTRWSTTDGRYTAWDETIEHGQDLAVSYVLSQPDWSRVSSRWNRTFTLKAAVTVGGSDTSVHKEVVVSAPTSLPPNVRT